MPKKAKRPVGWLVGRSGGPGRGTTTYLGNVQSLESACQRDRQTTHNQRTREREEKQRKKEKEQREGGKKRDRQKQKVVTKELGCSLSVQHS